MEFEKQLNKFIKVRVYDDSQRLSLDDSIFLVIQTTDQDSPFQKIGTVVVWAWSKMKVEWLDIQINNPAHRCKGIGSLVVQFVCNYVKENGAIEIFGQISDVDNIEKVKNFWEKNGFSVSHYSKLKGHMVSKSKLKTKHLINNLIIKSTIILWTHTHFLFICKDQFPVLLIDGNYRVFIDFFFQDHFGQFIL